MSTSPSRSYGPLRVSGAVCRLAILFDLCVEVVGNVLIISGLLSSSEAAKGSPRWNRASSLLTSGPMTCRCPHSARDAAKGTGTLRHFKSRSPSRTRGGGRWRGRLAAQVRGKVVLLLPDVHSRRGAIMRLPRRQFLHLAAGTLAFPAISGIGRAQSYPSRPVTIVVPFPPGAATDTIARLIADRMRGTLGQPFVVENVGGAGGTIGVGRVARAAPDGYTLCIGHWSTHVVNGAIYPLQYDVLHDFEPILLISSNWHLIVARKTLPATNLRELVVWLKSNPDKATAGTGGVGTPQHIGGIVFQ
jgi:hypothetical protein